MVSRNKMDANASLSMRERISYGCGGMGNAIVLAVVSSYLMFFYTDVVNLNAGIIASVLLASRVFDGISDLVMGQIVDKTKSKYGKGRCWLLWLCVPYAVSGVLLFMLQSSWPEAVKYIYVFVTYNLTNTVMFTGLCVPYNAMNCLVTANQYERGVLGTTNVMGNVIGQMLVNTFIFKVVEMLGNNQNAWILATAIFGVIGIAMHMICFTQTVERNIVELTDEQGNEENPGFLESLSSLLKNKYWLIMAGAATLQYLCAGLCMGGYVYFASIILGDAGKVAGLSNSMNIAQMVIYFLSFYFLKKLGKGNSYRIGLAIAAAAFAIQIPAGANYTVLLIAGAIKGIGTGMAGTALAGLISDTIEYGEWKTGVRCVGMGNAANTFAQKIGSGFGASLVGWLLAAAGYNAAASTQSAAVITVVHACFSYLPLGACVIAVLLLGFYKLDKEYPQIIKELEERRTNKKVSDI